MSRRIEVTMWGVTVLLLMLTVHGWHATRSHPDAVSAGAIPHISSPTMFDDEVLSAASDSVADNDPFRTEHRAPTIAFGSPTAPSGAPAPVLSAPVFELKGLVGGPPWQAIIAGVPGHDGNVVVRSGDTLGRYRIRAVTRRTVIVAGPDSVSTLTIHPKWQ